MRINHNKTNILFLFWGRKGGGARYSYEISKELSRRKDVNLFLSVSNQCDLIKEFKSLSRPGLYIDTYESTTGFINKWIIQRKQYLRKLKEYLKKNDIDVLIIGMDFFWGSVIYKAAESAGVKTIYVVHEPRPHPREPFFMGLVKTRTLKTLIKGASHLVALTQHVKDFLLEEYQITESSISVIPHGVFSYHKASKSKQLPENDPVVILYFGAITYYKGLDILLEAYRILEQKYDHVKLEIWGSGTISEYENLISDIERIRVENRWIDESEVEKIFKRSHICVLPYRDVSQSGIVGAAGKAALPVVACPAEGLREQMEGEGIVFSEDFTPESLALAIEELLTDADFYNSKSQELLDYSKKLSWSSIASDFKKISEKLLDE